MIPSIPSTHRAAARGREASPRVPSHSLRWPVLILAFLSAFSVFSVVECHAQTTTSSAAPGIKTGKTLYVDGTNGSNTTAVRGRLDKPYLTIAAAITAASSGDTVQVRSGNYAEFLTLKNGVNLAFDPGAKLLHTSGNGTCISDASVEVDCIITGLQINASGAGSIDGIDIGSTSSDIILSAEEIVTTNGTAISTTGTLRGNAKKVSGQNTALLVTGGSCTFSTLTLENNTSANNPLRISGGTAAITIGTISNAASAALISFEAGTSVVTVQKLDDTNLSAIPAIVCTGGTHTLFGGTLARTTTGNGITCSAGTVTVEQLDITGTFSGADVALAQSATGTINVMPNVHYPAGETSGTITFKNFLGVATTAGGRALTGVTGAADTFPYWTSSSAATSATVTSYARTVLGLTAAPSFIAYNSNATFAISTGVNKLVLNAEQDDSASVFDTATNYRWTPNVAGMYLVGCSVSLTAGSNGESGQLFIYKNGTRVRDLDGSGFVSVSLSGTPGAASIIRMNGTTDYIEFYTYITAGTATANGSSGSTLYTAAWGILLKP